MSTQQRREEFRDKVKAAHNAIDSYAETLLSGSSDWFPLNLDGNMRRAIDDLVEAASIREVQLHDGPRDGLVIKTARRHSIEVAYIEDSYAVRCDPDAPKPWTQIKTVLYRSTNEWDEGREIFKPDWATVKVHECSP